MRFYLKKENGMGKNQKNTDTYQDIIGLPHHVSRRRPQMPLSTRAAQFLPFAALTGFDEAVEETARLTADRIELDENVKLALNDKLLILQTCLGQQPAVRITFFKKDDKKAGGMYLTAAGNVKKIDMHEERVIFLNGTSVKMEDIVEMDGEIFAAFME